MRRKLQVKSRPAIRGVEPKRLPSSLLVQKVGAHSPDYAELWWATGCCLGIGTRASQPYTVINLEAAGTFPTRLSLTPLGSVAHIRKPNQALGTPENVTDPMSWISKWVY